MTRDEIVAAVHAGRMSDHAAREALQHAAGIRSDWHDAILTAARRTPVCLPAHCPTGWTAGVEEKEVAQ